jgi:hypothetical protein
VAVDGFIEHLCLGCFRRARCRWLFFCCFVFCSMSGFEMRCASDDEVGFLLL